MADKSFKVGAVCKLDKHIQFKNVESEDNFYTENKEMFSDIIQFLISNPDLVIEIGCHTDSRGSDDANLKKSQKNAESIVAALIRKKIPSEQLQAKGYGESQLAVPNEKIDALKGEAEDNAHNMNRRTELKIIEINGI